MKMIVCVAIGAIAGCMIIGSCGGDVSFEARLAKAEKQIERQQFEKALKELRPALENHPTDSDLLCLLTQAYLGANKPDSAHYYIKQHTALYPTHLKGYRLMYRTSELVEDWDSQIFAVSQMGYIENNRRKYHLKIAELNYIRGEYGMAIRTCNQIFEYDPDNIRAKFILANSLSVIGKIDSAIAVMEEIDRAQPNQVETLTSLGMFWVNKGDYRQAAVQFRRLTGLYPEYTPGWFGMGNALLGAGDTAAARKAFMEVYRRDSTFFGVDSILRSLNPLGY